MLAAMIYRIGDFELDLVKVELREAGVPLEVEPQVFALLAYLVDNRERLISKDEIFEKIWDGRNVSDAALTSRIKLARKLLGDDGKAQKVIKTAYGKGYRFVADVQVQRDNPAVSFVGDHAEQATPIPGVDDARPSIAVLPFKVIGTARKFSSIADGLPHELITELARLRWLLVIARGSSFRLNANYLHASQIGRILGVRYVLSGSVEVVRQRLIVTTELVDARDDEVVWGEHYSGFVDDVHALREDIRSRVLTALEIRIPLHEAEHARLLSSDNLDAWSAYHLGLQHLYRFNRKDNAAATEFFTRAVTLDPNFARAHAGLSFLHFQTAFMRQTDDIQSEISLARSCAQRGLDLDPLDPFVNFTMGRSYWLESDLGHARSWLQRATELSPNYAQGMYALAWTNTISGAGTDDRSQLDLAMRLSPLDPLYYAMLGARGFTHIAKGEYAEALSWTEQAARAPGAHVFMALLAAATQALAGNRSRAAAWAADVRKRGPLISSGDFFRGYPVQAEPMRSRIAAALQGLGF